MRRFLRILRSQLRGGQDAEYLCTDGSTTARLVVEDKQPLFLYPLGRRAREDARNGGTRAEEGGVAREVDVGVDVDEEFARRHGLCTCR